MIPLMGLLLCVYLIFKGVEIFQIAWCATNRSIVGIVIGAGAILSSVVIAGLFAYLFISLSLVPTPPISLPTP